MPDLGVLWIAVVPAAVAVGLWALLDLQRFLLFAVLPAMIYPVPLATPGGAQIAIADALMLVALGAWLIENSVRQRPAPFVAGNRFLVPALLFVLLNVLSLAWSDRPRETVEFCIQLVQIVIVLPLLFASVVRSIDVVHQGFAIYVAASCVLAAFTIAEFAPRALAGDLEGTYLPGLHKNAIGSYLGAAVVIAFTLWLVERRPAIRKVFGLAALVSTLGLFATVSRGSLLGAAVALIAVSFLLRRRRTLTAALLAVAGALFFSGFGADSRFDRTQVGSYDSSEVREASFDGAIQRIQEDPVFGVGAGAYQDSLPQFALVLPDPNNMFLLTWAEIGAVGVAALLLLLYRYAALWRATRELPPAAAALGVAAGGVALSLFAHFQVDVTWTRGTTSLAFAMIGLVIALSRLAEPATSTSAYVPPLLATPRREPASVT